MRQQRVRASKAVRSKRGRPVVKGIGAPAGIMWQCAWSREMLRAGPLFSRAVGQRIRWSDDGGGVVRWDAG